MIDKVYSRMLIEVLVEGNHTGETGVVLGADFENEVVSVKLNDERKSRLTFTFSEIEEIKAGAGMKYFEFREPYYAFIKAESEQSALNLYKSDVCEDEDDEAKETMIELSKAEAKKIILNSRCTTVEDALELLKGLKAETPGVLLIDGALI